MLSQTAWLRLLQRVRSNVDTARWLREQSSRAIQHAREVTDMCDRARSERTRQALETERPTSSSPRSP